YGPLPDRVLGRWRVEALSICQRHGGAVAQREDRWVVEDLELPIHQQGAMRVPGQIEALHHRIDPDASRPDHRLRGDNLAAGKGRAAIADSRHTNPQTHVDLPLAELLEHIGAEPLVYLREQALIEGSQHEARVVAAEVGIVAQRAMYQISEC